jgi:hypothetical protein
VSNRRIHDSAARLAYQAHRGGLILVLRCLLAVLVIAALSAGCAPVNRTQGPGGASAAGDAVFANALNSHQSGIQVTGAGVVAKVLTDDNSGDRHQRFILRLASGQTLLIAHNIDIAPKVTDLQPGDSVEFYGVYEWNPEGGTVHWTHRDPSGTHQAGWLRHNGESFQ